MYSKLLYMDFPSKNLHKKDLMGLFPIFLTIGRRRRRPFAILKRVTECDGENFYLQNGKIFLQKCLIFCNLANFHKFYTGTYV